MAAVLSIYALINISDWAPKTAPTFFVHHFDQKVINWTFYFSEIGHSLRDRAFWCPSVIMYVLVWRTVSALTRGLFWCLCPELRSNQGNKRHNNTRVSAETVRHESTYIILFLKRHNESKNDDKNYDLYTHHPRVSLTRFSFCWWCHNRLLMTSQWPDNCDAITWMVISN